MKFILSKHELSLFLSGSGKQFLPWLIIIGVILFGALVLKIILGLWAVVAVGIAGIFIGGGAYLLRNRTVSEGTNNGSARKSLPQIASAWDYRPRDLSPRSSTSDVSAETTDVSGLSRSVLNENKDVWFNFAGQESDS